MTIYGILLNLSGETPVVLFSIFKGRSHICVYGFELFIGTISLSGCQVYHHCEQLPANEFICTIFQEAAHLYFCAKVVTY